jgi:hypothetical protein
MLLPKQNKQIDNMQVSKKEFEVQLFDTSLCWEGLNKQILKDYALPVMSLV